MRVIFEVWKSASLLYRWLCSGWHSFALSVEDYFAVSAQNVRGEGEMRNALGTFRSGVDTACTNHICH